MSGVTDIRNHLAYAAMRCSDQGFVTLDQSSTELGTLTSMQQMAQYKEAALVQKGPARDALVAAVSQRLVDRLQECRQFIRGEKAEVKFEAPTAPLTTICADTPEEATPAKKQTVVATPAPPTSNIKMEGIRRSKRIAAARSLTVVAEDPTITNIGADKTQELRLLARTCANEKEGARDDINLGRQEGEDSTLDSQLGCSEGESALGVIKEPFYEYPKQVVALLELGYLVEREQGAFLRIQPSTQRKLHPDLSRLARQVQREQREQETFDGLLDRYQLYPLGNDIFCDEVFHQTTQPLKTHNRHGEEPQTPIAISSGTQFTRDPYLTVVETSPDLRYDYPPMLEALVQLGFLREYDKRVFRCIHDPKSRRKAFSVGVLAVQGLHCGLEDVFLKLLILQG
jgi:hypothetical protein